MKKPKVHCIKFEYQDRWARYPAIDQGVINGFAVSWNPDDDFFYAYNAEGETVTRHREWRNLIRYVLGHDAKTAKMHHTAAAFMRRHNERIAAGRPL